MSHRRSNSLEVASLALALDESSNLPLYRQLYNGLRDAMLQGGLAGGLKLPSTRELALQLGFSRNTVTAAFEQLLAEGYLRGKPGSGTYVSERLPERYLVALGRRPEAPTAIAAAHISRRACRMMQTPLVPSLGPLAWRVQAPRAFRLNLPAVEEFPQQLWLRLLQRRLRSAPHSLLGYGSAAGYEPLRRAIAAYVQAARAVRCDPEQVIIVTGSQQGLDLASRVLLDPGDRVIIEDPGYLGARATFLWAGAELLPVPVNEEGLDLGAVPPDCEARAAYLTPSHQHPLGCTMSLSRRLELLEWARRTGAYLIEDDYDSEFRYQGRPIASLQGLDAHDRVIYLGTFSKVLLPALRLGYLVVPRSLAEVFTAARGHADCHSPLLEQAVLADFIEEGHFARHIRRMRALYHRRQTEIVEVVQQRLRGLLDVRPQPAGLHVLGWLPEGVDDRQVALAAVDRGVDVVPLSRFALQPLPRGGLVLGYACIDARAAAAGAEGLRDAIQSVAAGRDSAVAT